MIDRLDSAADRIEAETLRQLGRIYPAAVSPLMEKHKATFDKLSRLEKDGAYGRARVLIRRSEIVDDFARAIAAAGREAASLIRSEMADVKEVASDDAAASQ